MGRVPAIILSIRIDALRKQPFDHPIACRWRVHRKHGLHQKSKTFTVLRLERRSMIDEKLRKLRHRSLDAVVQYAAGRRSDGR